MQDLVNQIIKGTRSKQDYVNDIGKSKKRPVSHLKALWQLLKSLVVLQKGVDQVIRKTDGTGQVRREMNHPDTNQDPET